MAINSGKKVHKCANCNAQPRGTGAYENMVKLECDGCGFSTGEYLTCAP